MNQGGIADDIMPVLDGELAGEDGPEASVARRRGSRGDRGGSRLAARRAPSLEAEEPSLGEEPDELGAGTRRPERVRMRREAGDAVVAGRDAESAGLVAGWCSIPSAREFLHERLAWAQPCGTTSPV